jgi:hypothetical protein
VAILTDTDTDTDPPTPLCVSDAAPALVEPGGAVGEDR